LWRVALDGGALRFDANSAAGGDFSSFVTPLTMTPGGNVGIGTTPGAGAKLTVAGGDITWGNNSRLGRDQGGSIELGGDSNTAGTGTPYIDFHFSGVTEDFNTRIINDANGQLTISAGTLRTLGDVAITGRATVGAGVSGFSPSGTAVWGDSNSGTGVIGTSPSGRGVTGVSTSGRGVVGFSDTEVGMDGVSNSGIGVRGTSGSGIAVNGFSPSGTAVRGDSNSGIAVRGDSNSGIAVWGVSNSEERGFGVFASGRTAGLFGGPVDVFGDLTVINGNKPFKIDHPLDPQNKYLLHNAVEAPERKNVYDGVAQLDAFGATWVELPEWFEALNGDFRYQLTAVGGSAPNLHVAEEVSENRFKIAGGEEGMKICWQLTGTRKDPWAAANPFEVEQEKPQEERGRYLEPSLYDAPEEQRVILGPIAEAVEEEQRIGELRRLEEEQRREMEELLRRMEEHEEEAPPEST
jgi:hypothetical protein